MNDEARPPSPLRIAAWQCASGPLDVEGNLDRLAETAARAAERGADVLVTPECFVTGYDIGPERTRALAEPADGPIADRVGAITRATGIAIAYGYPELAADGAVYNAAALVDGGVRIAAHRKLELFGDLDRSRFAPGAPRPDVALLRGHRVGLLICYDVEHDERVRALAAAGAETILVPTANPIEYDFVQEVLLRARAYDHGVAIAYANYCGPEGSLVYGGLSTICGPDGRVLAAAARSPELVVA